MTGISDDLARLISRIAAGRPTTAEDDSPVRAPKPIYLLAVDDPDDRSIVLIVRTGGRGDPGHNRAAAMARLLAAYRAAQMESD